MTAPASPPVLPPRPAHRLRRAGRLAGFLALLGLLAVSVHALDLDAVDLGGAAGRLFEMLRRASPPDGSVLRSVLAETWLTVEMALLATALGALAALPLGFLAARNVVPSGAIRGAVRTFLNAVRSIDTLVYAVVFVYAFGLGPLPGVMALAMHSTGMLGKLCYEAIETAPAGPIDALVAAGGSRLAVVRLGILPQVGPHLASFFIYRLELNIRSAVVLGLVGAGGVGFLLEQYMNLFQFRRVAVVVLAILVLVMALDALSARVRRALGT